MQPFHFLTLWHFDAPLERVWDILSQPERFTEWWPGFEHAEMVRGERGKPGSATAYRVRGDFGFVFDFTMELVESQPPESMKLVASGDFVGTGEWALRPDGDGTAVTYIWNVDVRKPWIRFLSMLPGARHRLEQSHDRVMTEGGRNLARLVAGHPGSARRPDTLSA